MLILLMIAAAACSEPSLSIYLAVSDDRSDPPAYGPSPRFVSCAECTELQYAVAGMKGTALVAPDPILSIEAADFSESWIYVQADLFDPERLYFQVLVFPNPKLAAEIEEILSAHWNDRVVVTSCSAVTSVGRVTPRWRRNLTVGVFASEREARSFAESAGLGPRTIPYDKEQDAAHRDEEIRAILAEYEGSKDARDQIAREQPELHLFLERNPAYLKFLGLLEEPAGGGL